MCRAPGAISYMIMTHWSTVLVYIWLVFRLKSDAFGVAVPLGDCSYWKLLHSHTVIECVIDGCSTRSSKGSKKTFLPFVSSVFLLRYSEMEYKEVPPQNTLKNKKILESFSFDCFLLPSKLYSC